MVTRWLFQTIRTTTPPATGDLRTLRHHFGYAIIGWAGLLFFLALAVGVSLSSEARRAAWFCLPVFGFFALLSAVLIVMYHRCTLTYDAVSIRYSPLWGRAFTFAWADIETVRFSGVAQWWRLRLRDGRNARVSTYMHGALEFMQVLAARTRLSLPAARMPDGRTVTLSGSDVA